MTKEINLTAFISVLGCAVCATNMAYAQDAWQWRSSVTATTGQYSDAIVLKSQQSWGLRLTGEKDQTWGWTAGLRSTDMAMQPNIPVSGQRQIDGLLSGFVHAPSVQMPGRWTLQMDAYRTTSDATNSISSDVYAIAPQMVWQSYTLPVRLDAHYARSKYKNTPGIDQFGFGVAYGFNAAKNWVQWRGNAQPNLTPEIALGHPRLSSSVLKFTHLFEAGSPWTPSTVTLGVQRGQKMFAIDPVSQTLYNLPMLHEGGESITSVWKLSPQTGLTLHWGRDRYRSAQPLEHRFTHGTLSAQVTRAW
jgi:hypothetical protein